MRDPETALARHAEHYERIHHRHPYTDAYGWAEAIVAWHERRGRDAAPGPDAPANDVPAEVTPDRSLVVAGIAECLRLAMHTDPPGGTPAGDVDLGALRRCLHDWTERAAADGEPFRPGDSGWPAPAGRYADRWHTLMAVLASDRVRGRRTVRAASRILGDLYVYAADLPHLPPGAAHDRLMVYRYGSAHAWDVATRLAEVAPALGMRTVPVHDRRWYEGIAGLDLVELPL